MITVEDLLAQASPSLVAVGAMSEAVRLNAVGDPENARTSAQKRRGCLAIPALV